jgi:hypothetical protein
MRKWRSVENDPPKRAGTYLVVMEDKDNPEDSLIDVQIYWPTRKEWDCDWSDNMKRSLWTTCPKPKGFIGQKWRELSATQPTADGNG